jgi:PAS domain S-box-containing protein
MMAAEFLIKNSLAQALQIPLIAVLGWTPLSRSPEFRASLFQRRRPTLTALFFSYFAAPALTTLLVSDSPRFDDRLDDALCTTLQLVVLGPILTLLFRRPSELGFRPAAPSRTAIILATLLGTAITLLIFGPMLSPGHQRLPVAFVLFPLVIVSALATRPIHHAWNLLGLVLLVAARHLMGLGPFHIAPSPIPDHLLHAFLITLSSTSWVVNVTTQETLAIEAGLEKQVEERTQALRGSEAFVNAVLENIPDMIFVKDARDLRFVRFNRAGEELIGRKRTEMLGKNDYDFFPKEEADHFTSYDRSVIASGGVQEVEERISTKAHGERWLRTKKVPIVSPEGTPQFIVGISEDITVKREAEHHRYRLIEEEAARREAEKNLSLRNEFLAVAAHELRTPVSALKLGTQLGIKLLGLPDSKENRTQLRELLQIARDESLQLQHLTENLLDVSRIHEGKFHINLEQDTDLSALVAREIEQLRPNLEEARCSVLPELRPGIRATVDPERIRQLLDHLLQNAAKFGRGTPVQIRLQSDGEQWTLEVADQGIGIDADTISRLFHPFERATSYRNFPGLGLGLFISREIIAAHGGHTRVEGKPGQGARFIFSAPLDPLQFGKIA